jgi:hypothetical protein
MHHHFRYALYSGRPVEYDEYDEYDVRYALLAEYGS